MHGNERLNPPIDDILHNNNKEIVFFSVFDESYWKQHQYYLSIYHQWKYNASNQGKNNDR